jgi:hypothetical protein
MHLHKNGSTTFIFSTILNYFYHFQPYLLFKNFAYLKEVIIRDFDKFIRVLLIRGRLAVGAFVSSAPWIFGVGRENLLMSPPL